MFEDVLKNHLKYIAEHYGDVPVGADLAPVERRTQEEAAVFNKVRSISAHLNSELPRHLKAHIHVKNGTPKGAWSKIYYVSFHKDGASTGPQNGIYPVFLFAQDLKICHFVLALASATVGITPRAGWTHKKGDMLESRAKSIGMDLQLPAGWRKGPIQLGSNNQPLSSGVGKGYEQGVIASFAFDPRQPPDNLLELLNTALTLLDQAQATEEQYLKSLTSLVSDKDALEQLSAAVLGKDAEEYFLKWARLHLQEWGEPKVLTHRVGLGYDLHFPNMDRYAEVKGCRDSKSTLRLTSNEMRRAESLKDKYFLVVVIGKLKAKKRIIHMIQNPYAQLEKHSTIRQQLQIFYSASLTDLLSSDQ